MENKRHPPPSRNYDKDFLGASSIKGKSRAMDLPGTTSEYSFLQESRTCQVGSLSGIDRQGNIPQLCSNQMTSFEPISFRHQFENDHFNYRNEFLETRSTSSKNFQRIASFNTPPQFLQYEGPLTLPQMPSGQAIEVLNWLPEAHNASGQTEAHKSMVFPSTCDVYAEKHRVDPRLEHLVDSGIKDHSVPNKMPLEAGHASSECERPVETLQPSFVQSNFNRRTSSLEAKKFEIPSELEQNSHFLNNAGTCHLVSVGTASLGASVYTNENHRILLQNQVQFGSAPFSIHLSGSSESRKRNHGEDNKVKEEKEAADMENLKYSFTEGISSRHEGSPANILEHGQENNPSHGSPKLDDKSRLSSENAASLVSEKLWNGSIQLNSSITVSAVAFFKSGEKLLDVNWSEFVEVKGKVRLEAFEKYIQDLPRSRTRGLMVISLCLNEGSSGTGLNGMKEVAKGYQKGGRVGFAKLAPAVDLYLCPRSEAIITILAKCGFFKGMAAVEDNRDSLVGCVVWRKNQTSSNSSAKKSKIMENLSEQPLKSPSDCCTEQVAEKHVYPVPLTSSSTLGSAGGDVTESKNVEASEIQIEVDNSSPGTNFLPTSSVPSNSSPIPTEQQTSAHSHTTLQGSQGHLLEIEASLIRCSGMDKLHQSLEPQKTVISLLSDVPTQTMLNDDDDLPEFDFSTACGIFLTPMSKTLDASMHEKKILLAERVKNIDTSVLPTMPVVQELPVSNHRSGISSLSRIPSAASQGMPPLKKVCEHKSNLPKNLGVQSKVIPTLVSAAIFASPKNPFNELPEKKKKNLFDDDDDMPEWWPLDLHKQSLGEAIKQPSTALSSEISNSVLQNIRPGPPRPLLLSPSPAVTPPPFYSKAFSPAPRPVPFQSGPCPLMGVNSNSVFRPPSSSSNVKLPFGPAGRRGWRP